MADASLTRPAAAGAKSRPAAQPQVPSKAARKPTNVSLPTDLLERARQLNVNVSRASERGLREEVEAAESRA